MKEGAALNVQPVSKLKDNCSASGCKNIGVIVVRVYQVEVGYRSIAPLEAGINVQTLTLRIILDQGGQVYIPGECYIKLGTYQSVINTVIRFGLDHLIVGHIH